MEKVARSCQNCIAHLSSWVRTIVCLALVIGWLLFFGSPAGANHQGHATHQGEETHQTYGPGYAIAGASFRVYPATGGDEAGGEQPAKTTVDATVQTVLDAFSFLMQHRIDYPRFDEAMRKDALQAVIIESVVLNREGKAFPFLVARTKEAGRVKLLISASSLKEQGLVHHPEQLVPLLAKEFQWVVSKADTAPKSTAVSIERDLKQAPIHTYEEIREMTGDQREQIIQRMFDSYLRTVDDLNSLDGQPYYEVGTTTLVPPPQPDSTTKLYDIRIREALQTIVREPYFLEQTPKAVRSLLNGKIWNVSFVKIDRRDWATRTRVLPEDKSIVVGEQKQRIQPATILVNTYRRAAPDDPYNVEAKDLPMGALSADQLARVIAWEIEHNIIEKSMRGHVAQDELTAPK